VPQTAAAVEVLQAKLDGAQAAARLHAQRRREEYLRLQAELERREAERTTLETEMSFLRERLVQAEDAERELRILIAQSVQAQQQTARELQALREERERPALPPPARVRWWLPWKR
jgi:hypothetical protein